MVARALAYANGGVVSADPNNNTDDFRLETQDRLARIVFTGNKKLAEPLGTLVDFLDDPPTYLRSKKLVARVRRAADKVERICGHESGH